MQLALIMAAAAVEAAKAMQMTIRVAAHGTAVLGVACVRPHFQRLRSTRNKSAMIVFERMRQAYNSFTESLSKEGNSDFVLEKMKENIEFLQHEMKTILSKFIAPHRKK